MHTRRAHVAAVTSLVALTLVAGCSVSGSTTAAAPAGTGSAGSPSATGSPAAAPTATSTGTATPTTSATPTAGSTGIPAGAGTATTVDLDGDGRPDTLWLADVDGRRELGVTTTSHGTSVVAFTSAAPQAASASAAVLASGAPVVLLNTGRSVQVYVYRVEGPSLGVVHGVTGDPYSFSLGFTDYGTGLTCEAGTGGLHLYGENAVAAGNGTFTVTRTEVDVSAEHSVAQNGQRTTVGAGLAAGDPRVQVAHGTTCGDGGVASEPQ